MTPQTVDQLGVCSWSIKAQDPSDLIARLSQVDLRKVHLALNPFVTDRTTWENAKELLASRGFEIVCGMFGAAGEDYSTLEAIRRTGGVVPDETWSKNWAMLQNIALVAENMGLTMVSGHMGFLPEDPRDRNYGKLLDRLRQIAELFGKHNLTLIFETGQETAEHLAQFLDVLKARNIRNVGVNFDPANIILYDKGDPIDSLRRLMPWVKQVHIKDARRTRVPGSWGSEVPVGEGEVNWKAFLQVLAENNYAGNLMIEREAGESRYDDIRKAVSHLAKLMKEQG